VVSTGGIFGLDWVIAPLAPVVKWARPTGNMRLENFDVFANKTIKQNGADCCWRIYYSHWKLSRQKQSGETISYVARSGLRDFERWATRAGIGTGAGGILSKHPGVAIGGGAVSVLGGISAEVSDWRERGDQTRIISWVRTTHWEVLDAWSFEKGRVFRHNGPCDDRFTSTAFEDTYSKYRGFSRIDYTVAYHPSEDSIKNNSDDTLPGPK
jgi:hypothetical protein